MELEELKELINSYKDSENADMLKDTMKEIGFVPNDEVQGLENKKNELLKSQRKLKDKLKDYEKKIDNNDESHYIEQDNGGSKEYESLKKQIDNLNKKIESKDNEKSEIEQQLNRTITKNSIQASLDEAGIDGAHKNILTDAFLGRAQVDTSLGDRQVFISDNEGIQQPVKDFFKQWANSDNGRPYLKKQDNSGSGSQKFSSSPKGHQIKRADFDQLSPHDKKKMVDEGVKVIN